MGRGLKGVGVLIVFLGLNICGINRGMGGRTLACNLGSSILCC